MSTKVRQVSPGTLIDNLAVLEHVDGVTGLDCAESRGDQNDGLFAGQVVNGIHDCMLGSVVEGARRFIEE